MADRQISIAQALSELGSLIAEIPLKAAQHDYYKQLIRAIGSAFEAQEKTLSGYIHADTTSQDSSHAS